MIRQQKKKVGSEHTKVLIQDQARHAIPNPRLLTPPLVPAGTGIHGEKEKKRIGRENTNFTSPGVSTTFTVISKNNRKQNEIYIIFLNKTYLPPFELDHTTGD